MSRINTKVVVEDESSVGGVGQNDEKSDEPKEKCSTKDAGVISAACQSPSCSFGGMAEKGESLEEEENCEEGSPFYNPNYYENGRSATVPPALLTLLFSLFNPLWSLGLSYWHFQLGNFEVAVASLVIIILSGSITTVAFFGTKSLPSKTARRNLWKCSKLGWILCAVPCLVPVILALVCFISSFLDNGSQLTKEDYSPRKDNGGRQSAKSNEGIQRQQQRPLIFQKEKWRSCSVSFFLWESLTLCFPTCVMHLVALLEQPDGFPSIFGFYNLLGLVLLSVSITFSRFQYDSTQKPDRFGEGKEKYLRFGYLWSAKIIWLVTFGMVIVTARRLYPEWRIQAAVAAIGGLTAVHEIPLWICLLPACGRLAGKLSGLFFLIPQATSLVALIYWVNIDPETPYHTNFGSVVLGVYFWSEAVMLCGWLADGNADKDIDLVPLYPHFFGDFISACFEDNEEIPYVKH